MSSYQNEPSGEFSEDSYVSRPGHKHEPIGVVSDQERIEHPIDGSKADSDAQLGVYSLHVFQRFSRGLLPVLSTCVRY